MADEIEFSEDEEDEDNVNLKGAARWMEPYKPQGKKGGRIINRVDESNYFDAILRKAPDTKHGQKLNKQLKNLRSDFDKNWMQNRNTFSTDM